MLVVALILAVVAHSVGAQSSEAGGASDDQHSVDARIATIQSRLDKLGQRSDTDKPERERAVQDYKQALTALQSARDDRAKAARLAKQTETAPAEMRRIREQQRTLDERVAPTDLAGKSEQALSARLDDVNARIAATRARLTDLRDRLQRLAQRPDAAREALSEARDALQKLDGETTKPDSAPTQALADAKQVLAGAKRDALAARIERLQQELDGLDEREQLFEARRALAEQRLARDTDTLSALQTALGNQQTSSAQTLKQRSESKLNELRSAAPPITEAAQRNVELAGQLSAITKDSDALAARLAEKRDRVEDIQQRLSLVQRKLEIGAGSVALGDVLRAQRRELAKPSLLPDFDARSEQTDIARVELQRFQLQQTYSGVGDARAQAKKILSGDGVQADASRIESLTGLLEQQRRIAEQLIDADGRYVDIGRSLRTLRQEYTDTLVSFNRLLDERLFWLPSFRMIAPDWPLRVVADLPWALDPGTWREALAGLVAGARARPIITGLALALLGGLIWVGRPLRGRLRHLAEPVGNVRRDHVWLTLRALLITVLLALPAALALRLIGFLIIEGGSDSLTTRAIGTIFVQLSLLVLFIEPFTQICRANGLAQRHFMWSDDARNGLRRLLRWLLFLLVLPTVLITFTEVVDNDAKRETLGRAAFMFASLVLAGFSWRLLHPDRGVLANVLGDARNPRWRYGFLWLPLAAGIPLLLAGLAAWGFYYTALQLQTRFVYSAGLLGGCRVLFSLIVRWLTVAERRLALTRALRKREEARAARASREAAAAAGEGTPDNLDALEIDLVQISEQTRGLIKVVLAVVIGAGLWLIWSDTLPALTQLNGVTLWQHAAVVDGKTQLTSVTLGALLLALAVGVLTWLAGRNLPGFLEITILRRFSLESGSRYAVATLFQYAIVILGLLVAVSLIGLRWSSIQWLVAAIGVGLGFGLQEIFANFVSGIVILFERPVRVGDTVTVGTLTGTVSRIRIRATTVTDWDNKEVVIPNKTFITETVINWTLTDDITRLVLSVDVAHDADADLVEELIMQAIKAEPAALDEPAPSVFVVGYGDSSVRYEMRIFYHDLYNLLPLQHAVYRRVHKAFRAHGIQIVFPQHDLHLRSVEDSVVRALRPRAGQTKPKPNDDEAPAPEPGG